ncbi:MAG: polysulfide reductase NrfD [Acidobacteria bacterium]|nr:polysulfide reductase NrfD [Acidobacteriota bacterium]
MFEKAVTGSRRYWVWLGALTLMIGAGFAFYLRQLDVGLAITGLSRDVTWGLYIAQFTFLVGVAASAVVVVLPFYLHDYRVFARITILGEFLAISAVVACGLFIVVDMGQPSRVLNVLLYPTPSSVMFWDLLALGGYLALNAVITLVTLSAERQDTAPPAWIRPVILLSIPWAVSIHTVTAFLYSGLPGRPLWLTALLAPRFLASAFASGPALLILLCLVMRRITTFDAGREPLQKLSVVVTYAMTINLFFILLELFTVFYAQIPEHVDAFRYLYVGLDGRHGLVPWTWASLLAGGASLGLLLVPAARRNEKALALACGLVFVSVWIDKGIDLIVGGFVPSPLGAIAEYAPTVAETVIALGIWAIGGLMVTVFYKITLEVRDKIER